MYSIYDKSAYITRLQAMLGIPKSGRLDRRTVDAIEKVKSSRGLTSTELVDYNVFLVIKEYAREQKIKSGATPFLPFESSEQIRGVNGMLGILVRHYLPLYRIPKGVVYGYDTQRAVTQLRKIYMLKELGGACVYKVNPI